jgi:hypothetical protein
MHGVSRGDPCMMSGGRGICMRGSMYEGEKFLVSEGCMKKIRRG